MSRSYPRSRASVYIWGTGVILAAVTTLAVIVGLAWVRSRADGIVSTSDQARGAGLALQLSDLAIRAEPSKDVYREFLRASEVFSATKRTYAVDYYSNEVLSFRGGEVAKLGVRKNKAQTRAGWDALKNHELEPGTEISLDPEEMVSKKTFPVVRVLELYILTKCADAITHAESRDLSAATEDLKMAVRARSLQRKERGFLAFRRQMWSEIRIQRALLRLLQLNPQDRSVRQFAQDVQQELGAVPSVKWNLGGELALVLDAIKKRKREKIEDLPLADMFKQMGRADVIRIFTNAVRDLPDDPMETDGLERVFEKMDREAEEAPIYGAYANGYRVMEFGLKDLLARRRLVRSVMSIWDRVQRGEVVSSLPETLGEDRIDPHSGKPFKVVQSPKATTVYSVGRDGIDDGGSEEPPKKMQIQTRDVIFAIPKVGGVRTDPWTYQKDKFWR